MKNDSNQFVEVLLGVPVQQTFTYQGSSDLKVGAYVQVPFGKRSMLGIVWKTNVSPAENFAIKDITLVYEHLPPLSNAIMGFIEWVGSYYMVSTGMVLKMLLSIPLKDFQKVAIELSMDIENVSVRPQNINLSSAQQVAADAIADHMKQQKFSVTLLEGITGSGKTEVYFKGIELAFQQAQQSLILLPEISLSQQWLERFERRFNFKPLIWHSSLTPSQRRKLWAQVAKGQGPFVVVGARSALFLPFTNLGYIIVDEEHDAGYKQESGVMYNARDMAVVRAKFENCFVLLVSATPSLETLKNVQDKKYEHLLLTERHGNACLPKVHLVDMRSTTMVSRWISRPLFDAMNTAFDKRQQVLLFLNRRGYSPFVLCKACGSKPECPHCDATLVYHKKNLILQCHYCGYKKHTSHLRCTSCQANQSMQPCGPGVERLEEEVRELFPNQKSVLISSDTLTSLTKMQTIFRSAEEGEIQLLIGTQILAKGHHFPHLALVGIIDGDLGLHGTDLRAPERTYQLLHQVSGRAGREHHEGQVILQTYASDNPVMEALVKNNLEDFLQHEMADRKLHGFPPFGRLAAIILSSHKKDIVEKAAKDLAKKLPSLPLGLSVWGPTPAVLLKLKRQYRWRFLIKANRQIDIQNFIGKWMQQTSMNSAVKQQIDIDPYSFF